MCFLCQGTLGDELEFRGNLQRGEAECSNGQGESFHVLWDETGVVVWVREQDLPRWVPLNPPPPAPLQGLTDRAGSASATGWLWICGDSSSPRLPPSEDSFLGLIDNFCGPSLITDDEDDALERELFEAILAGQEQLSDALVSRLLDGPVEDLIEEAGTRLAAARALAEELSGFGLLWPNLERDVAERGE